MINGGIAGLNERQLEAATKHFGSHLIIFAGPGAGKTLTLTLRVASLTKKQVRPNSILALTFTKKAANEMKKRINSAVPCTATGELSVLTFHGFAMKILKANAGRAQLPYDFSLISGAKQRQVLQDSLQEYLKCNILEDLWDGDVEPLTEEQLASLGELPSEVNNECSSSTLNAVHGVLARAKIERSFESGLNHCFRHLLRIYNVKLREKNCIDLSDILSMTIRLLKTHSSVLLKYQEKYRFILVDEFQDTNLLQLELLRLVGERAFITVCGDDDQAIYGWRGATNGIFEEFSAVFANAKQVILNENFRSTAHIVAVTSKLIGCNRSRVVKDVHTQNPAGTDTQLIVSTSNRTAARDIAKLVLQYKEIHELQYKDIAILYRFHRFNKELVRALQALSIPVLIQQKKSYLHFDRNAKAILSYIRLALFPSNDNSFLEIYNWPKRGIGRTTIQKITQTATAQELSLYAATQVVAKTLKGGSKKGLIDLFGCISYVKSNIEELAPSELIPQIAAKFKMSQEVVSPLIRLTAKLNTPGPQSYTALLALFSESDSQADSVHLSTIHQAKGQEWRMVVVVGLVEGVLPSVFAVLEEERRLAYVACTRSKELLVISTSLSDSEGSDLKPSRFIEELQV